MWRCRTVGGMPHLSVCAYGMPPYDLPHYVLPCGSLSLVALGGWHALVTCHISSCVHATVPFAALCPSCGCSCLVACGGWHDSWPHVTICAYSISPYHLPHCVLLWWRVSLQVVRTAACHMLIRAPAVRRRTVCHIVSFRIWCRVWWLSSIVN